MSQMKITDPAGGEFSGSGLAVETAPNYEKNVSMYSNTYSQVKGKGMPGVACNIDAAKGGMKGGNRLVAHTGVQNNVLAGKVTGPKAGHPLHGKYSVGPVKRGGKKMKKAKKHSKTSKHAMKHKKHMSRKMKKSLKHKKPSKHVKSKHAKKHNKNKRTKKRMMKGGYKQPYSNQPSSFGYSLGVKLPNNLTALANPPPQRLYNHCQK